MRIVLLGARLEGKSSSGNTILGRKEFEISRRTAGCVKREGEIAGRHITVVEAPGWWKNLQTDLTPEHDKQEIALSVSLCLPGPHALLLVINVVQSFGEAHRRAVQEHLELLGKGVWSHTIVLFTHGDYLEDATIEEHIDSAGKALKWVVEKCGNRYQVVENKKRRGGQVTELLEKIEKMVAGNKGRHFDFDAKILKELVEKKREEKKRAEERKMRVKKQRETLKLSPGGVPHISDMRIVLLGGRNDGKSSSGNTILGRKEFGTSARTDLSEKKGKTAGRNITLVEAPGWWMNYTAAQTPESDKQKIILSVSQCSPGPHGLILVVNVSLSFPETYKRAMQEHMELLGEGVWSHTIVLFTRGDWLGDTSIEEHIESGGDPLKWVVEKCGNRYHVVDNEKTDGGQVTELLEKIEEMVAGNKGRHFNFDEGIMEELMEKRTEQKRRAEERKMKVKKQSEAIRALPGGVPHISDMKIVLLGNRGEGKSSSGNTILGRKAFEVIGRTAECLKREGEAAGRRITVVDTPGWWRNAPLELTPEHDKKEIILSVSLCPPGPHAILLLISVTDSFTLPNLIAVKEHLELLDEGVWSHTMVLFTHGDKLGDITIEEHIESLGDALKWVLKKCGNRYHIVNNKKSEGRQVIELLEKIEEMVAGNGGQRFDFDAKTLKELMEKRREERRRAVEKRMKVKKQRESLRSSAGGVPHLSDMRIMLLGARYEGKSSTGNTILGRELFGSSGRTAECMKREGERAGRHITLVEAPGWWKNENEINEYEKREIILSVTQCSPGPHALILVIDVSRSFTETHRRAVQEHLELFGERVWSHSMVVFTYRDWLGNTTVEQHIESGEALKWVVEKCGNRYQVVDNKKSDGGQVTELLEKIEEMVAGNRGRHFDFDAKILKELIEKKKEEKRRAEERKLKVKKQREALRASPGGVPHISQMRIVLLGSNNAGKSLSGNTILGKKKFNISVRASECVKREGETAGRHIAVVKAPGWRHDKTESDKREVALSASMCPPGPHALVLVINVSNSFTEAHKIAVQEHLELLGEKVWSHTIVLFTKGDWLGDTSIEQHIESGGEALKWVVEKCGNRYHVIENSKRDDGQVIQLLEKIEEMVAGNRGSIFQIIRQVDNPSPIRGRAHDDEPRGASNREHTPDDGFGSAETGRVSGLKKFFEQHTMGSPAPKQRPSIPGGFQNKEQNLTLVPDKSSKSRRNDGNQKSHFVDPSTITVNYNHLIGKGAFGAVYRGTFHRTPAAIKIIPNEDSLAVKNEFQVPLRLAHPNIIRMIAVAKTETQILIANEYIHGANLHEILYTDSAIKLSYEDKLFVAIDVAMALDYIHEKEIIHQDLKPANIMVAKDNKKAYLTDWGMANYMETYMLTTGYRRDRIGPHGGTILYTAPECLTAFEDCSTMSDMWSLGITLLEMFTSSVPWLVTTAQQLKRLMAARQAPHAMAKLQPSTEAIVKPLLEYDSNSRMKAKDLVTLLMSKVDLTERSSLW